jgi:DNA-binding transcriptional regulator YiaG
MANLASALKEEIGRLARREVRQQTAGTAKSTAQMERDIAALKRQVQDLQRKLSPPRAPSAPSAPSATKKAPSKKTAAKKANGKAAGAASKPAEQSGRARFSAKGLKTDRERLGLSADNYGKLVGVSGLSIYNWEQGKARPRESSIAALMSVRGIGKREAAKRLENLAKPAPKAKAKAKPAAKEGQAAISGKAKSDS